MTSSDLLRADVLFEEHNRTLHLRTDRLFMIMLLTQWVAAIVVSVVVTPYTWVGTDQSINPHVWAALFLCGVVVSLPVFLAWRHSGATVTRHCIAIASMLMVGLLVHLSGGRIETHFHYFGTLAFLAFYRDWKVIVTATIVAGLDHLLRGVYWPYSIFGELTVSHWRWLEHVGWVIFEDIVLFVSIAQVTLAMRQMVDCQARMA